MAFEKLKIVSAGGGAPNKSASTALTEAVNMSHSETPGILIIPSAKTSADAHEKTVRASSELYEGLGLKPRVLHDFGIDPTQTQVEHEIGSADVVYISGGDTARMMEIWIRSGAAKAIGDKALKGSLVISGISAGAIAPFMWGHSDSLSFREETKDTWDYIPVAGLGLIPAAITPHYNTEHERLGKRSDAFKVMFDKELRQRGVNTGFGIDNFAAVKVQDGKVSPLYYNPDHRVTALSKNDGEIISHIMSPDESISIEEL